MFSQPTMQDIARRFMDAIATLPGPRWHRLANINRHAPTPIDVLLGDGLVGWKGPTIVQRVEAGADKRRRRWESDNGTREQRTHHTVA